MSIDVKSAWDELRERVRTCTKCGLCETRHNTVFGEGPLDARCVLIGEGPGQEEDISGRPFYGPAGQLLTKILQNGGGINRDSLYIMNVVKCHPPGETPGKQNRTPRNNEAAACAEHFEAQLALLHPEIVVTLGATSLGFLLHERVDPKPTMSNFRGKWLDWRGIRLLPMYHPSFILRNPNNRTIRKETWDDVRELRRVLDLLQGGQ